ncbi:MAG: aldehyde dehydrogenase family protein [Candidatus Latescibacteria bacterium]|nr:aldehyde dehydrogenase family protein [Candidatus Latescibacterota bacterium]
MDTSGLVIDGQVVTSERTFDVINPATEDVVAACSACSAEQLDLAITSAVNAFDLWRTNEAKRRKALIGCARAVKAEMKGLAELLTLEQGKPRRQALHEVSGVVYWFQQTASLKTPVEIIQDDENGKVEVRRKPLGVVGAITPWNYPLILAVWKIAPALLAGNTVVLKPSPHTPLSTLRLGEILQDVLPPGVLNVVSGDDELGAQIVAHPSIQKISLTGSIATGKAIAREAASDLKRLVLELGGNDAAIILPDVDVKAICEPLFWGAFENSGQVCQAIKRLYVHTSKYQELTEELASIAQSVKVGDGMVGGVQLGPVNNRQQFDRVIGLVEDAKGRGATIATGGSPLNGPGFFYPPTLVTDISDDAGLVAEEQFGPVLPILPFDDVDDAISRANATQFGLSGSIWTEDIERGTELVPTLECGTGWVNQHNVLHPQAPVGGVKWSGIGYQNGRWGFEACSSLQVIHQPAKVS